jgi:DNA ligase-1
VPRFPSFVRVHSAAAGKPVTTSAAAPKPASKAAAKSPPAKVEKAEAKNAGANDDVRYFEFSDGKSNKFWEISSDGLNVTVRFGRIGANGQTQTKSFANEAAAEKHASKLIDEKTEKGYIETARPE